MLSPTAIISRIPVIAKFAVKKWDLSGGSLLYIQDPHFVIIIPADALAPNRARPSAGTLMTTQLTHWPLGNLNEILDM